MDAIVYHGVKDVGVEKVPDQGLKGRMISS